MDFRAALCGHARDATSLADVLTRGCLCRGVEPGIVDRNLLILWQQSPTGQACPTRGTPLIGPSSPHNGDRVFPLLQHRDEPSQMGPGARPR
jgi:hypothetical protein